MDGGEERDGRRWVICESHVASPLFHRGDGDAGSEITHAQHP